MENRQEINSNENQYSTLESQPNNITSAEKAEAKEIQESIESISKVTKSKTQDVLDGIQKDRSAEANAPSSTPEKTDSTAEANAPSSTPEKTDSTTEAKATPSTPEKTDSTTEAKATPSTPENNETSPEVKREKVERIDKKLKDKATERTTKLKESGNEKQRELLFRSELKMLFDKLVVNSSGTEIKPFEGLDFSKISLNNASSFSTASKLGNSLIQALASEYGSTPNLSQDQISEAKQILNSFREQNKELIKNKDKYLTRDLENKYNELKLQRQTGEISSIKYFIEYKKLLKDAEKLKEYGLNGISLSQGSLFSTIKDSPSVSYFRDIKNKTAYSIKKSVKTFFETQNQRGNLVFKGAYNTLAFPVRYAFKIPAQLLGFRYFTNKIRKKVGKDPLTISGDFNKDIDNFAKGIQEFFDASDKAGKIVEKEMGPYKSEVETSYQKLVASKKPTTVNVDNLSILN